MFVSYVNQLNMALLSLSEALDTRHFFRKSIFYYNVIRKSVSTYNTFSQLYILIKTACVIFKMKLRNDLVLSN